MRSFHFVMVLIIALVAIPRVASADVPVTPDAASSPAPSAAPVVAPPAPDQPTVVAQAAEPQPADPTIAAPAPAPAPEPSIDNNATLRNMDLQLRTARSMIDDLARKDTLKGKRISELENRVTSLEEDNKYRTGGIGLGLSIPTGGGNMALEVTGNLQWLSAYYYVTAGGGAAFNLPIHIGPVTIRPLGLGFMYYADSASTFSSTWLNRSVDMVLPVGVDVRVWKGLQATVQASWFLPNPVDTMSAAGNAGSNAAKNLDPNFPNKSGDVVSKAYGDAMKTPRIEVIAKWVF